MTDKPTQGKMNPLESSVENLLNPYQPPKLMILETSEIEGGVNNLQEGDGGTGFVS
jgi:hypothetical protein